jgi:hypothetical protein
MENEDVPPNHEDVEDEENMGHDGNQLEGQIIEGQIVDGRLVTADGQIEGQIEEIVTPGDMSNEQHMINSACQEFTKFISGKFLMICGGVVYNLKCVSFD